MRSPEAREGGGGACGPRRLADETCLSRLREVPCQLPLEALNPVAAVTVGLRQAEHSPASFPAIPD